MGHDTGAKITFTGANSSCEIVFGDEWDATPITTTGQLIANKLETPMIVAESSTGLTFEPASGAWESGDIINFICIGSHDD